MTKEEWEVSKPRPSSSHETETPWRYSGDWFEGPGHCTGASLRKVRILKKRRKKTRRRRDQPRLSMKSNPGRGLVPRHLNGSNRPLCKINEKGIKNEVRGG